MLKVKFLYAAFVSFFQQIGIRSTANNTKMLFTNLCLIFSKQPEPLYKKRHELNRQFLKQAITLPKDDVKSSPVENYRIWVLWWQGESQMPPIVRCTYNSICKMTDKEVVLITKDNWKSYINPASWIEQKVLNGKMKLPALSDYIRASLLYEYGGMWIDSTVLCTKQIPSWIFEREFFSIHNDKTSTNKYVANGRWNVQILGTNRKHLEVFHCLRHVFAEYWKKYDYIMDYLLVDYSIDYAYNEKRSVKNIIDSVPCTNQNMHAILSLFDKPFEQDIMNKLSENTWFFKLTYKHRFIESINGKPTFFKYIIDKYLQ